MMVWLGYGQREWREMSRRHEWYLDDLGLVDFAKDLGV